MFIILVLLFFDIALPIWIIRLFLSHNGGNDKAELFRKNGCPNCGSKRFVWEQEKHSHQGKDDWEPTEWKRIEIRCLNCNTKVFDEGAQSTSNSYCWSTTEEWNVDQVAGKMKIGGNSSSCFALLLIPVCLFLWLVTIFNIVDSLFDLSL